jgi:hypothetical protein
LKCSVLHRPVLLVVDLCRSEACPGFVDTAECSTCALTSTSVERLTSSGGPKRPASSGGAVSQLLADMPPSDARDLAEVQDRLLQLEHEINDDVLAIVRTLPRLHGFSALVVTASRLIEIADNGGLAVLPFPEVQAIHIAPGSKKLFGGYEMSILTIETLTGIKHHPMNGDHAWALWAAETAQSAFNAYRLRSTG